MSAACADGALCVPAAVVSGDKSQAAFVKTADLRFGEIFTGTLPNSVTLAPDGTRTATVFGTLGDGAGAGAAAFLLTGKARTAFFLWLPSRITLSSGTDTMTVRDFTSNLPGNSGVLGGKRDEQTITIGATLLLKVGQTSGWYTGAFEVVVDFE